ncbi:MAG TPA: hypothetical protein VM848_14500 [Acidimicrobiia bacterium]|nr:hypothetical protein [Acidimicrobiia bacterium]
MKTGRWVLMLSFIGVLRFGLRLDSNDCYGRHVLWVDHHDRT